MNYLRSEAESLEPGCRSASPESHSCALMTNISYSFFFDPLKEVTESLKYFSLAAQTSGGNNIIKGHNLVTARPENESVITF